MSRGSTKVFARVSPTLLAAVVDVAQRRGVDQSTVIRDALLAYLRQGERRDVHPSAHVQKVSQAEAASLLQTLDATTQARLAEGMSRFQCSAADLMRSILRRWGAAMLEPRQWRVWRP
jgi:hypothetical protein